MTNSSYVGRVGGLAVALGIGAAVASGNAVASASPSTATAGSAGEATPSATVGSAGAPDPFRPRKGRPGRRRHSPDTTHITGPALRAPAPDAAHPQSTNAGSTDRFVRPASASVVTNTIESQVGKSAQPATTTTSTSAFTLAAAHSQPVIAQAAPATLTAPVTPSINTLTDVLAAFGLAPLASNHPLAPAEPPVMWGLLSWTRRQNAETAFDQSPTTVADTIQNSLVADPADPPSVANAQPAAAQGASAVVAQKQLAAPTTAAAPAQEAAAQAAASPSLGQIFRYTFFNKAPTVSPSSSSPVTGNLNATGPSGATLTYTVTQGPTQGSVVVSPVGSYTYTPGADLASTGGTDSFTITVDDGSAYRLPGVRGVIRGWLHSFAQAIGLSGPDTTTATITVSAVQPPSGFTATTLVSGLTEPTDMAFLPDGRMLITEKGGQVLVASSADQVQSTPLITLPTDSTFRVGCGVSR